MVGDQTCLIDFPKFVRNRQLIVKVSHICHSACGTEMNIFIRVGLADLIADLISDTAE